MRINAPAGACVRKFRAKHKQHRAASIVLIFCAALGSAQAQDAGKPQIDYTPVEVAAQMTIAADGSVESFVPETGPIPTLRSLLAQRSSSWRLVPPVWRGQAVRLSTEVVVTVNLAKRPDGSVGAILRNISPRVSKPAVPELPRSLRRKVTTLVYAVDVGADGAIATQALLWPAPAKKIKSLDATTRPIVNSWRAAPLRVAGQPIACADVYWVQFANSDGPLILPDVPLTLKTADGCPRVALEPRFVSSPL